MLSAGTETSFLSAAFLAAITNLPNEAVPAPTGFPYSPVSPGFRQWIRGTAYVLELRSAGGSTRRDGMVNALRLPRKMCHRDTPPQGYGYVPFVISPSDERFANRLERATPLLRLPMMSGRARGVAPKNPILEVALTNSSPPTPTWPL